MYSEKKIGPTNRLNLNRYNLIVSGVIYQAVGLLFHFLDAQETPAFRMASLLPFLVCGGLSILMGVLTYRSCWLARKSFAAHYGFLLLFSANFAIAGATHGFTAPYFSWALLGPFAACAAMVTYRKFSLIVHYAWLSYGFNILAGAWFGTGSVLFSASNLFAMLMVLPTLSNIVRDLNRMKEKLRIAGQESPALH